MQATDTTLNRFTTYKYFLPMIYLTFNCIQGHVGHVFIEVLSLFVSFLVSIPMKVYQSYLSGHAILKKGSILVLRVPLICFFEMFIEGYPNNLIHFYHFMVYTHYGS